MNPEQPQQFTPDNQQQPPQQMPQQQPMQQPMQPGQPMQPEPKKSKKTLFIVIILVLLLLVGGAVAYMLLSDKDTTNNQTTTQNSPTTSNPDDSDNTTENQAATAVQNDIEQKLNASRFIAGITEYTANNNGNLPEIADIDDAFIHDYYDGDLTYPVTGSTYEIVDTAPVAGQIQYRTGSECDDNDEIVSASSKRSAVARVLLSDDSYYCVNN